MKILTFLPSAEQQGFQISCQGLGIEWVAISHWHELMPYIRETQQSGVHILLINDSMVQGEFSTLLRSFDFPALIVCPTIEKAHEILEKCKYLGDVDFVLAAASAEEKRLRIRNKIQNSFLRAQQISEKVNSLSIVLRIMAELSTSRDNISRLRLLRISRYIEALVEDLWVHKTFPEIDHSFLEDIRIAGALYDIGKINTPDYVLLKQGKLTDQEKAIMRQHAVSGARVFQEAVSQGGKASFLKMASDICENHHERYDGTGCPIGKKGEEIPLSVRIISVAISYEKLRTTYLTRESHTHEESVQIIKDKSGIYFDHNVVASLLRIESQFSKIAQEYLDLVEKSEIDFKNLRR